jgi:DGQHR domain-containing protein
MPGNERPLLLRYSVSLVTQGRHRFYTLTMPSDVLVRTCFVSTREEDPKQGFQRLLDRSRAQEIANYIDNGLGTIPNSVVLSAQADAELRVVGRGKTIEFRSDPKAFLILDGQHRVYGFSLAKTALRVPVVIYNGLSRKDESRLFIDINTKQRPVPNELLLDIKRLAEYETTNEQLLGEVFDLFATEPNSPLVGKLSSAARSKGQVSRVTFYSAVKPLLPVFQANDAREIYEVLRCYVDAFVAGLQQLKVEETMSNPTVFRGALLLFIDVGQRVKDKYGATYSVDNFSEALQPMFGKAKRSWFVKQQSLKEFRANLAKAIQTSFTV